MDFLVKETERFEDSPYMLLKTVRTEVCSSKRIPVVALSSQQSQETYSQSF